MIKVTKVKNKHFATELLMNQITSNADWNHTGHYHNLAHLGITDLEHIVLLDAVVDFFFLFFVQRYLKQTP